MPMILMAAIVRYMLSSHNAVAPIQEFMIMTRNWGVPLVLAPTRKSSRIGEVAHVAMAATTM